MSEKQDVDKQLQQMYSDLKKAQRDQRMETEAYEQRLQTAEEDGVAKMEDLQKHV